MAKKKLKTSKNSKVTQKRPQETGRRSFVSKPKNGQTGTKVQGQVIVPYVQTGVPESHAVDVCEALGQLILSDAYRGYVGVTHKDENEGF